MDIGQRRHVHIWAAKTRGVKVFAFEPEAQNYALLNRYRATVSRAQKAYGGTYDQAGYSELNLSAWNRRSCHALGAGGFQDEPMNTVSPRAAFRRDDDLVAGGVLPTTDHISST